MIGIRTRTRLRCHDKWPVTYDSSLQVGDHRRTERKAGIGHFVVHNCHAHHSSRLVR
jgi:hypothetical protein